MSTARKPTDVGRILEAARLSPETPLVTLAMGEVGFPSHVISTALGSIFTYVAPAHVQGTASGQVNARQLRSVYRIDKFTKERIQLQKLQAPISRSSLPVRLKICERAREPARRWIRTYSKLRLQVYCFHGGMVSLVKLFLNGG